MIKTPLDEWIAGKIGVEPGVLSKNAIFSYQIAQLQKTITLAKDKSAFYRKTLAMIDPGKITDFVRFAELPFTFPQDIAENPHAFVCTSQREIERIVSLQSSGTTGAPKRLFFTKEDQELTIDFFDYGMRNLVGPRDRVLILLPWELPGSVGDLLGIALKRMGAVPIPFGPVYNTADAISCALHNRTDAMVGIPTHVLRMARHQEGEKLRNRINSVLLTTDYVPQAISEAVANRWGCSVFNHYGMTEMGLGGGVQCSALLDYHLREADLYFEIIDPETRKCVPDGEYGEVVFTTLTRNGMPLIRYRTGDISRFLPDPCPCGSVLRRMEVVQGRISGRKKIANSDFSIIDLDEALFKHNAVLDYRCRIEEKNGQEHLNVLIKATETNSVDPQEITDILRTIPAVQKGLTVGILVVNISTHWADIPISKGTSKRKIEDLRLAKQ
ncbi:AMP-binding protein [Dehalobacter sp. DCM]|uniref:DVU_1553 family AMP-dependent CoA ligase n=1 Tax=Dehalobacter sp. DCM TaxID=2907827 RepID=UPI0030812E89|nr:AMP-binding protein [Dehalobacter sp. DCM]